MTGGRALLLAVGLLAVGGCAGGDDHGGRAVTATPLATATTSAAPSRTPLASASPTNTALPPTAAPPATATVTQTPAPTPGEPGRCADFNPRRNIYFGDLHVHTAYSFDAQVFDVRTTPADAYRFARGEALALPPLDGEGHGTQLVRLDRPLDFAAVTDHSEFLGEVEACTTPGSPPFDTASCQTFRAGGTTAQAQMGFATSLADPQRNAEICGADGTVCALAGGEVWQRTIAAAEQAYDRTAACTFTALVGYEYTANTGTSARHRNVLFRSARVPAPTTYIEQPTAPGLWAELRATCLETGDGCDALAIPHNPNQSNGHLFDVEYPGAASLADERAQAAQRAAIEPLLEIYQHKGDSECMNGLSGVLGAPDELCGFEKLRRDPVADCGDMPGSGGTINAGCVSRRDFARGALLAGLQEAERIGVNPFPLGFVGGTDTHDGTPGAVAEDAWLGHRGNGDDTPGERLETGFRSGVIYSPGGITGVWAEENSRAAIFDALRRREVFATSGPRIAVRLFGGWDFTPALCGDPGLVEQADARGVAMGDVLGVPPSGASAPVLVVAALRDPGTAEHPGVALQRVQIVKGWLAAGVAHEQVFDVAGDANNGAHVDEATCAPVGAGAASLCGVWTDPAFDPAQRAFYYARVLQNPTCRWSTYDCNRLPAAERPPACADPAVPKTVQERAWTSPIWYEPAG